MAQAVTKLSREQQIAARDFINIVVNAEDGIWDTSKGTRKQLAVAIYEMLGYQLLPNGTRIPLGVEVKTQYGKGFFGDPYGHYEDAYIADAQELFSEDQFSGTDETDTSESSEGDAVGDVLQQDV